MKLELALLVITLSVAGFVSQGKASDDTKEERATYLYCKRNNLLNEDNAYVCNFGKTIKQGCAGWQHGRIDKKDVKEVIWAFTQCDDGTWLSRIEVK